MLKKQLFLVLLMLIFAPQFLFSQSTFSKMYTNGTTNAVSGYAIIKTYDDGYLIAGEEDGVSLVTKLDAIGGVIWSKRIGDFSGTTGGAFNALTKTLDSNYVLAGSLFYGAAQDLFFVKVDPMGDTIWSKYLTYGTSFGGEVLSIDNTADNGYIFTGKYLGTPPPYSSIVVGKLDSMGNLEWTKLLAPANWNNSGTGVKQTPDGGYIVCASIENSLSPGVYSFDATLTKFSSTGSFIWMKKYNKSSPVMISGVSVEVTATGITCFLSIDNGYGIMKTDFSGNLIWDKEYISDVSPYTGYWNGQFRLTPDEGYICVGEINDWNCRTKLFKVDSVGNSEWSMDLKLCGRDVCMSSDSGYAVLGNGSSTYGEFALLKVDSAGLGSVCDTLDPLTVSSANLIATSLTPSVWTTGVFKSYHPPIQNVSLLMQDGCVSSLGIDDKILKKTILVYPNPTTGLFQIKTEKQLNVIEITNVLGETIYKSEIKSKSTEVDLSDKKSGIYFMRLIDEKGNSVVNKIIKE